MQARGRPYTAMVQKASSSSGKTSTLLQNSVLKKSQTRSFMTKFSKDALVDFSDAVMVSMAKFPVTQSPQRNAKNPIMRAKISKKNENQGVLKSMKKLQNTNIRKWVFKKEKIKPISPKPIYTCCGPKQNHLCSFKLGEKFQR